MNPNDIPGNGIFTNQANCGCHKQHGPARSPHVVPIVGLMISGFLVALVMALDTPNVAPAFPILR